MPSQVLQGDAYVITQGSGGLSINASLAANLSAQAWATVVSPEILNLGTVRGEPVLIRGVDPDAFLALEGGSWVQRTTPEAHWVYGGDGFAARTALAVGENVTLVGTAIPRIAFAPVAGIYRTSTPANDELLVDFGLGRFLSGVGPTNFHTIRVRSADPGALLAFLRAFGASVHVSGPGMPRVDIASSPPTDERIENLILRTGIGGAPRDYLSTAVTEASTSARVLADGIAVLLAALIAFGVHAVQARAFADRVPVVGVLRAVGAGNGWMLRRLLMESLPLAIVAGALGAGLGLVLEMRLQPVVSLLVFGHTVQVSFDAATFVLIVFAIVSMSIVSSLMLLRAAVRERPASSMREFPAVEPPESLEVVVRG